MDFADRIEAERQWFTGQRDDQDIFKRAGLIGGREQLTFRAMGVGEATLGELASPQGFANSLIAERDSTTVVRSVATLIQTDDGNPLRVPTCDDTANVAELADENAQRTEETDFVIGSQMLGAHTISSRAISSRELLADMGAGVLRELGRQQGRRVGRKINQALTTGTGTGEPQGVATGATIAKTVAADDAITPTDLIDLFAALPDAYHAQARFMMRLATLVSIIKAEDGDERPIYDIKSGLLLGKPVVINPAMPAMAADAKAVLFGDFSTFVAREVGTIDVRYLLEERATLHQAVMSCYSRVDSKLLDPAGVVALRMAGS